MKIQLLSDLHLEAQPTWVPSPAPGADVLVLAGDIGSYQAGSRLTDADFGLARFSPLEAWPCPVLFVPGNHEYDALDFDAAYARLRQTCERLGILWLEREVLVLDGVRFVGTTLWTDFDAVNTATTAKARALRPGKAVDEVALKASALKARDKAFRAANHYLRKTGGTLQGQPLLAEQVRALGLQCQAWLRSALAQPHAGPTVVVTHFAPSLMSADPRYGLTPGTAGFCNALDSWLHGPVAWLHGHLHAPSDYMVSGCRVVANPLGYEHKGEQAGFAPHKLIEVNNAA